MFESCRARSANPSICRSFSCSSAFSAASSSGFDGSRARRGPLRPAFAGRRDTRVVFHRGGEGPVAHAHLRHRDAVARAPEAEERPDPQQTTSVYDPVLPAATTCRLSGSARISRWSISCPRAAHHQAFLETGSSIQAPGKFRASSMFGRTGREG
jgi:hypothetical protein